jgi:hypothetical protein
VGGLLVDLPALAQLAHRCDPRLCRDDAGCCATYEVPVTDAEMARIVGLMPEVCRVAKHLPDAPGEWDLFEQALDGWVLAEEDDGLCCLAMSGPGGVRWCAVHAAAGQAGLDPLRIKPAPCALWPLALGPGRPALLTVTPEAYEFPCNRRRRRGARSLHAGVAEAIAGALGPRVLREISRALADM